MTFNEANTVEAFVRDLLCGGVTHHTAVGAGIARRSGQINGERADRLKELRTGSIPKLETIVEALFRPTIEAGIDQVTLADLVPGVRFATRDEANDSPLTQKIKGDDDCHGIDDKV